MEFSDKLDDFIKTSVEERLNKKLDKYVIIAESRTREEYGLNDDFLVKEWVVSHIKMDSDVYTVSHNYEANRKFDEIVNLEVEEMGELDKEMREALEEVYGFCSGAEMNINGIRIKTKQYEKEKNTEMGILKKTVSKINVLNLN